MCTLSSASQEFVTDIDLLLLAASTQGGYRADSNSEQCAGSARFDKGVEGKLLLEAVEESFCAAGGDVRTEYQV